MADPPVEAAQRRFAAKRLIMISTSSAMTK
jgi:hypothetical protein